MGADALFGNYSNYTSYSGCSNCVATGSNNIAFGSYSLSNIDTGSNNVGIGNSSLSQLSSGSSNTAIGDGVGTGTLTTGSRNILLGVDYSTTTPASGTNDWLNIGNAIYGYNLKNNTNTTGVPQIAIGTGITSVTAGAVLDLSSNTTTANSTLLLPIGTTGARPATGVNGMIRYNSSLTAMEAYINGAWASLATSTGSSSTMYLGTLVTAANPQINGDATTGLYTAGAGLVDMAVSGVQVAEWASTGLNIIPANTGLKLNGMNAIRMPTSDSTTGGSIAIGSSALSGQTASAAYSNTAIGSYAMGTGTLTTAAIKNTAVGSSALTNITTGSQNTVLGVSAGEQVTSATDITAIGYQALAHITTTKNSGNTAVGSQALYTLTPGSGTNATKANSAFGYQSLYSLNSSGAGTISGSYNTAMGYQSGYSSTSATGQTAVGYQALYSNTASAENTALGYQALYTTNGAGSHRNVAVGSQSLYYNSAGSYNTAAGYQSLYNNTNGSSNTAFGANALAANTYGGSNVAVGQSTLGNNVSGGQNVGIGASALSLNTAGAFNFAGGFGAMLNSGGNNNIGIGPYALYGNYTAYTDYYGCGGCVATGNYNVAIGRQSMPEISSGSGNVGIGTFTLGILTTGSQNLALGHSVGYSTLTTGSRNILIGVDQTTTTPAGGTNNWLNIGNAIYGYNLNNNTNTTGVPQIAIGTGITSITAGAALDLSSNTTSANSTLLLPIGTTGARPASGVNGMIRYNSTLTAMEAYINGAWASLATSTGSSSTMYLGTLVTANNPQINGDATTGLFTPAASTVAVATGGVERLRVDSSGNVGIGTTAPGDSLDVSAGIKIGSNAKIWSLNSSAYYMQFQNAGTNTFDINGFSGVRLLYGTGSEAMRVDSSGLVGIGTATPGYALDINGGTNAFNLVDGGGHTLRLTQSAGLTYNSVFTVGSGSWGALASLEVYSTYAPRVGMLVKGIASQSADIAQWENSSGAMLMNVTAAGNVGIGTTTPAAKLDVYGSGAGYGTIYLGGANGISTPASDTTAGASIAIGSSALSGQTSSAAYGNTAVGYQTLSGTMTTAAINNTAVGYQALKSDTTGTKNTAVGYQSLYGSTNGGSNTALGYQALYSSSGNGNTALGYRTLPNNTGTQNTVVGNNSLTANSGSYNVALGDDSMITTSSGSTNVAVGYKALQHNTGSNNAGIGYQTLSNSSGDNNVAFGFNALTINTSGTENVAIGYGALLDNATGDRNIAIGSLALYGNYNSINYYYDCSPCEATGSNNIALGQNVMQNYSSGSYNIGLGSGSMSLLTSGSYNIGFGIHTLQYITTGTKNVAIGTLVGSTTLATGSRNILIGIDDSTDTPASGTSNWMNIGNAIYGYNLYNSTNTTGVPQIGIGKNLTGIAAGAALDLSSNTTSANSSLLLPVGTTGARPSTGVNGMIRYNSTLTKFEVYENGAWVNYTVSSDARLKTDVKPMQNSLQMVEAMRPVTYKWDAANPRNQGEDTTKEHIGFIAQELEKVLPDVVHEGADTYRTVHYDKIVTVAVGAIKEQQALIEKQQKEIDALKVRQAVSPANDNGAATPANDNTRLLVIMVGVMGGLFLLGMGGMAIVVLRMRKKIDRLSATK